MGGKAFIEKLTRSPAASAWITALGLMPNALSKMNSYMDNDPEHTFPGALKYFTIPVAASILAYIVTVFVHERADEKTAEARTRWGDFARIRGLKKQMGQAPKVLTQGEKELKYSFLDFVRFDQQNAQSLDNRRHTTSNPLHTMDTAIKYAAEDNFDESLVCIRDALDSLEGRRPKLGILTKLHYTYRNFIYSFSQMTLARSVENYILRAIQDSIVNPERAWHRSELGRKVADEFNHSLRKEMYLFHALLATAQRRNDAEQSWEDAFGLLSQEEPARVGESRNPVWVYKPKKHKKFFSTSTAFKGNKKREELGSMFNATLTLERILEGRVAVPTPVYISSNTWRDHYVYIERWLPGKTLYEELQQDDKNMIAKAIPPLARIHAKYPTNGLPKLNLEEKIRSKLYDSELGLPKELSNAIYRSIKPVVRALEEHAFWAVNKDHHPENIQHLEFPHNGVEIGILDAEIKELHPSILDCVNTLAYVGEFSHQETGLHAYIYADELRKEGIKDAYEDYGVRTRAFNNGIIYRSICWLTAWSAPDRKTMHKERPRLVKNILRAIEDEKSEDLNYYEQYKEEYDTMRKSFQKVQELIPP